MASLQDLLMDLQQDPRYGGDFGHLPEPDLSLPPLPPSRPTQGDSGGLNSSLLGLALAQRGQSGGMRGNGPGSYPTGNVPSGRGIFFNDQVDVLGPDDPRLVSRYGVTLARPAMRSLVDIFGNRNVDIGGGYRSPGEQASLYANKPGVAAPPGSSYHQEGLAIDLAAAFQKARWERQLAAAGWNRLPGEPWHWSYGVSG